jgi:hypothetical protein
LKDFENEKNLSAFLLALRTIAITSGGINALALKTNLNRQTLYKALSPQRQSFLRVGRFNCKCFGDEIYGEEGELICFVGNKFKSSRRHQSSSLMLQKLVILELQKFAILEYKNSSS